MGKRKGKSAKKAKSKIYGPGGLSHQPPPGPSSAHGAEPQALEALRREAEALEGEEKLTEAIQAYNVIAEQHPEAAADTIKAITAIATKPPAAAAEEADGRARSQSSGGAQDLLLKLFEQDPTLEKRLGELGEELSVEQKIFLGFALKPSEETHMDFKRELNAAKWETSLAKQVAAMYNAMDSRRYPSLALRDGRSSYLVYGVHEGSILEVSRLEGGTSARTTTREFFPTEDPPQDERLHEAVKNGTRDPTLLIHYFPVRFGRPLELGGGRGCVREGFYGLLEVPAGATGPAEYQTPDGAWEIVSRRGSRNFNQAELDKDGLRETVLEMFQPSEYGNLKHIQSMLLDPNNASSTSRLRILVVTPVSKDAARQDAAKLFKALGSARFDLIIDLDKDGKNPELGYTDVLQEAMRPKLLLCEKWQDVSQTTPKSANARQELVKAVLESRKAALLQLAGCSVDNSRSSTPSQLSKTLDKVFESFFQDSQVTTVSPPPLLLTFLLDHRDPQLLDRVRRVHKSLAEAYAKASEEYRTREGYRASLSLFLTSGATEELKALDMSDGHFDKHLPEVHTVRAPFTSIVSSIEELYGAVQTEDAVTYRLPVSGSTRRSFPSGDFAVWEEDALLLDIDCGKREWEKLRGNFSSQDELELDILERYHSGEELGPEALYLHDKSPREPVYAERPQMDSLKERIESLSSRLQGRRYGHAKEGDRIHVKEKCIVVPHDPSAGGTTVARVAVWRLRKRFPVLVVREDITDQVDQAVDHLYRLTELPVVVVVESPKARESSIQFFPHNHPSVPLIVVHVQVVQSTPSEKERDKRDLYVHFQLSQDEADIFQLIYKRWDVRKRSGQPKVAGLSSQEVKTPLLFGLLAFVERNTRLVPYVESVLDLITRKHPEQYNTLLVASYFRRHAGQSWLPKSLIAILLGLSARCNQDQLFTKKLGPVRSLLLTNKKEMRDQRDESRAKPWNRQGWASQNPIEWGMRPAVYPVATAVLDKLAFNVGLPGINIHFSNLLVQCCEAGGAAGPVENVVRQLLQHKPLRWDGAKEALVSDKHSGFIRDIFQAHHPNSEAAVGQCQRLAAAMAYQSQHLLSHCARYLMYELGQPDDAIRIVVQCLGLKDGQTYRDTRETDATILAICAHLIYCAYQRRQEGQGLSVAEKEELRKASYHTSQTELMQAVELSEKAQRHQNKSHRHPQPYVTEIRCRHAILDGLRTYTCKGVSQQERAEEFLDEEGRNDIADHLRSLIDAIFKLETICHAGDFENDALKKRDMSDVDRAKNWIAQQFLAALGNASILNSSATKKFKSSRAFAWILCEMLARKVARRRRESVGNREDGRPSEADIYDVAISPSPKDSEHLNPWETAAVLTQDLPHAQRDMATGVLRDCEHKRGRNYFELVILLLADGVPKKSEEALEVSREWRNCFEDDSMAAFVHASLALLAAVRLDELERMRGGLSQDSVRLQRSLRNDYIAYNNRQQEIRAKRSFRTGFNTPRFHLRRAPGGGGGGAKLVPLDRSFVALEWAEQELRLEGVCEKEYQLICETLCRSVGQSVRVIASELGPELAAQRLRFSFSLCLCYGGLYAVNVKRARHDSS